MRNAMHVIDVELIKAEVDCTLRGFLAIIEAARFAEHPHEAHITMDRREEFAAVIVLNNVSHDSITSGPGRAR